MALKTPRHLSQLRCHLHGAPAMLVAYHADQLASDEFTHSVHRQQAPVVGLRCHFHVLTVLTHYLFTHLYPTHQSSTQALAIAAKVLIMVISLGCALYIADLFLSWSWTSYCVTPCLSWPLTLCMALVRTAGHTAGALGFLSNWRAWKDSTLESLCVDLGSPSAPFWSYAWGLWETSEVWTKGCHCRVVHLGNLPWWNREPRSPVEHWRNWNAGTLKYCGKRNAAITMDYTELLRIGIPMPHESHEFFLGGHAVRRSLLLGPISTFEFHPTMHFSPERTASTATGLRCRGKAIVPEQGTGEAGVEPVNGLPVKLSNGAP